MQLENRKLYCRGFTSDKLVRVSMNVKINKIYPGETHSCVIANNGYTSCWGNNSHGETSPEPILTPSIVLMADGGATTWTSLTVGEDFTCGITTLGNNFCWGNNSQGQLGVNTKVSVAYPAQINAY